MNYATAEEQDANQQKSLRIHHALAGVREALSVVEILRDEGVFQDCQLAAVDHYTRICAMNMIARLNQHGIHLSRLEKGGAR